MQPSRIKVDEASKCTIKEILMNRKEPKDQRLSLKTANSTRLKTLQEDNSKNVLK